MQAIDIEAVKEVALRAGEEILEVYRLAADTDSGLGVENKGDGSPLTEADRRSHAVISEELRRLFPAIPVLSEEGAAPEYEVRREWESFWLVDPLDGTKEFLKRNGEFTVNIALIRERRPVLGVVLQPTEGRLYWAVEGAGAWSSGGSGGGGGRPLAGGEHYSKKDEVAVVASRSHLTEEVEEFVASLERSGKTVSFLSAGSSLKICLVADGSADVYPRFGPTMEWDTAAAHAIAAEAGRRVVARDTGEPLLYNKESLLNPHFLVE